jgi:ribosomal protein S18 acetylase RimI-like enzyme
MRMTVTVKRGLPEALRHEAAAIYWQAFGGKLGRVLGPEPLAMDFLSRTIRGAHCLIAVSDEGHLLGVAGFKTASGAFAGGSFADLRAVYGLAGATWRAGLLHLLERDFDNRRFLLDGICVAREARGQGVGSALLQAICDEAQARGYAAVRLDVVDTNWRARALYERMGFLPVDTTAIGMLKHVFGFTSATTMVKPVTAA